MIVLSSEYVMMKLLLKLDSSEQSEINLQDQKWRIFIIVFSLEFVSYYFSKVGLVFFGVGLV